MTMLCVLSVAFHKNLDTKLPANHYVQILYSEKQSNRSSPSGHVSWKIPVNSKKQSAVVGMELPFSGILLPTHQHGLEIPSQKAIY